jgi:tRNA(Ile)-lysidine synthetase-like protein
MDNTLYEFKNIDYKKILDDNSIKQIENINIEKVKESNLFKEFSKHIICPDSIIVSISGGVDSMVVSTLLYVYCLEKNIKKYAVCIDYNNRDQTLEIEMVGQWLKNLDYEYHVKKIPDITRANCFDRDLYEKITKKIRFDMYKQFSNYVILGHNRDDSIENIFSNIIKRNYNNLLGMTFHTEEYNINILRPLLDITKEEIYNFAKEFKVPYTYDSTPKWSERGKMRDHLIPQVTNFNSKIIDGLVDMSKNFSEIYKIYNTIQPNIVYEEKKCIIEDKEIYFFDYWKNIFIQVCKYYNLTNIKNKSIQYFIENINFGNKITLNKCLTVIKKDNNIILYYDKI